MSLRRISWPLQKLQLADHILHSPPTPSRCRPPSSSHKKLTTNTEETNVRVEDKEEDEKDEDKKAQDKDVSGDTPHTN